jgi:hypothetical protein
MISVEVYSHRELTALELRRRLGGATLIWSDDAR